MSDSLVARFLKEPDLHQNPRYAKAMAKIGWTTLGESGSYLYLKKIGPLAIAKIQHPTNLDLAWLKQMRQQHKILTTFVEPGLSNSPFTQGFSVEPLANSTTSLLDLTLSPDSLLKSFKQKTRYNIRLAKRRQNLTIITKDFADLTPQDLQIFRASRQNWRKRKKVVGYEESFILALLKEFTRSGWLHFAYHNDACVGTLMILKNYSCAIYYSAFAEPIGQKNFAPTLLTWQAILTAQNSGCTIFDFGGIYDPRYPKMYKKWQGFTKFKDGFNPTIVQYPPTKLLLGW